MQTQPENVLEFNPKASFHKLAEYVWNYLVDQRCGVSAVWHEHRCFFLVKQIAPRRALIACRSKRIRPRDLKHLAAAQAYFDTDDAWLITDFDPSPEAEAMAEALGVILLEVCHFHVLVEVWPLARRRRADPIEPSLSSEEPANVVEPETASVD